MVIREIIPIMPTRAVVEQKYRRRLQKKGIVDEEIERRVSEYMHEYDLKEQHRKAFLAGKKSYERAEANAQFENEWSKIRKQVLEKE